MKALRRLYSRIRNLVTRRRANRRLQEEIEEHLALQTEENIRAGMPPAEARRQALLKFGSVEVVKESFHAEEGLPIVERLLQDLRYSFRQLRRSSGYAVVAILTLALGIGANTAIFLLTYSILLKSLPVPHPEELIRFTFRNGGSEIGLSYPQYLAIEKSQGVATGLFAWQNSEATLRREGEVRKIPIGMATGSIFSALQMQPWLGRGFAPQAGQPGIPFEAEALVSYNFWQTELHSDRSILGRTLNIENQSIAVVGVLPPGFNGVQPEQRIDLLLPLSFEPVMHRQNPMLKSPGAFWLTVMGRLRPGQSLRQAKANLETIRNQVNETADPTHTFLSGGFFSKYELEVESGRGGRSWLRWKYSKPLLALEGMCGLMLLLCSVNAALLVLSRVSGRLHEFAMRSALGASRNRLLMQVLIEISLLGMGGLLGGSLLGWELASLLVRTISLPGSWQMPQLESSAAVLGFVVFVSMGSTLLTGFWPAWRASRTAPAVDLKQTGSGKATGSLGRWIIPTQMALGVLLLNTALLFLGTLLNYIREDSGFVTDGVSLAELNLADTGLPAAEQSARTLEFLHEVQKMPGIYAAALMSLPPLENGFSVGDYYSRDSKGGLHLNRQIWPESASVDYFATMGTRILQGRTFAKQDLSGDRVCILSAAAATYFFPDTPAVGGILHSGDSTENPGQAESCRVIGVAQDAHFSSLLDPAPLMAYFPLEEQSSQTFADSTIAIRAASSQFASDAIHSVSAHVFPGMPLPKTWIFREAVDHDLSRQRLLSGVSSGFAVLALVLVATGLYGILSRTVIEQRREIGIRMALGARRKEVVTALAKNTAMRIGMGVIAGMILAALASRLMHSFLYGVTFQSPQILITTFGVLFCVLMLAFVFPAARAAAIDPVDAIRDE